MTDTRRGTALAFRMPMPLVPRAIFAFAAAVLANAAEPAAARWEGTIQFPWKTCSLIIDLAQDGSGRWIGSATLPMLDVAGAPLSEISVHDSAISLAMRGVLGGVKIGGSFTPDGPFTGTLE